MTDLVQAVKEASRNLTKTWNAWNTYKGSKGSVDRARQAVIDAAAKLAKCSCDSAHECDEPFAVERGAR